jgi:hypothetical protein
VEAQVVARAYRMGATGHVHVEELVAKDSIEEVMNQMVASANEECSLSPPGQQTTSEAEAFSDSNENETKAKIHHLLKSATLIRQKCQGYKTKKRRLDDGQHTTRVGVRFQED